MSKPSVAELRYGRHKPVPDEEAPGCCTRCPIRIDVPNPVHEPTAPTDPDVRQAEARRLGEREDNEWR